MFADFAPVPWQPLSIASNSTGRLLAHALSKRENTTPNQFGMSHQAECSLTDRDKYHHRLMCDVCRDIDRMESASSQRCDSGPEGGLAPYGLSKHLPSPFSLDPWTRRFLSSALDRWRTRAFSPGSGSFMRWSGRFDLYRSKRWRGNTYYGLDEESAEGDGRSLRHANVRPAFLVDIGALDSCGWLCGKFDSWLPIYRELIQLPKTDVSSVHVRANRRIQAQCSPHRRIKDLCSYDPSCTACAGVAGGPLDVRLKRVRRLKW